MSFFDDASLVFLPSGQAGKDGKAYSMKPTNGNGDFTFSRGSNLTATRIDSNGLIEKGRENLLLQSNQFDTNWSTSSSTPVSGYADRNGGTDAWLLRENASTSPHWIRQSSGLTSGIGTFSFYAKKKDYDWIQFGRSGDGGDYANFNISNGTLGNVSGASIIDRKIESVGNGWYRCSVTYIFGSNSFVGIALIRSDVSTRYETYAGDITKGTYIQDAQVEIGLVATEYIESGATTGKAGLLEDSPRFDYSGGASCPSLLLEPSRTNLIGQSEYYNDWDIKTNISFQVNRDTSPEGIVNAQNIYPTATGACFMYENISYTSGETYVYSVFAKSNGKDYLQITTSGSSFGTDYCTFDLSNGTIDNNGFTNADIEDYGNGWYRCYIVVSAIATSSSRIVIGLVPSATSSRLEGITANGTDGVLIYGVSNEQGSYPTSYIPNHSGGSVTRNAEQIVNTNISSIINTSNSYTIFFDFTRPNADYVSAWQLIGIDNGGYTSRLKIVQRANFDQFRVNIYDGTTNVTSSEIDNSAQNKIAIVYDGRTSYKIFTNGTLLETLSCGAINGTRLTSGENGTQRTIDNYQQISLFPSALSDAECITLTS